MKWNLLNEIDKNEIDTTKLIKWNILGKINDKIVLIKLIW